MSEVPLCLRSTVRGLMPARPGRARLGMIVLYLGQMSLGIHHRNTVMGVSALCRHLSMHAYEASRLDSLQSLVNRGTSLIINTPPVGSYSRSPYSRPMLYILGGSQGGGRFLMGEVPQ